VSMAVMIQPSHVSYVNSRNYSAASAAGGSTIGGRLPWEGMCTGGGCVGREEKSPVWGLWPHDGAQSSRWPNTRRRSCLASALTRLHSAMRSSVCTHTRKHTHTHTHTPRT
jgi:hypothetical protein